MVNDPIGDLIIQIKNAGMVGKPSIELPHSKEKEAVAMILFKEGYLLSVKTKDEYPRKKIVITLKYEDGKHAINEVKRMSKPGIRMYVGKTAIPTVLGGLGISVISTPQGIMTGKNAKKIGIGGELLCEVW